MDDKKNKPGWKGRRGLRLKLVMGFTLLAVMLTGTICTLFYFSIKESIFTTYNEKVQFAVQLAAAEIEGDQAIAYLQRGAIGPEFRPTAEKLKQIKKLFGLKYLYLFQADEDHIRYIYDAYNPGDDVDSVAVIGQRDEHNNSKGEIMKVLATGRPTNQLNITTDKYGYLASAYAPVINTQGKTVAIMAADCEMNGIIDKIVRDVAVGGVAVTVIIAVLISMYGFFIDKRIVLPLRQLTQKTSSIVAQCEQGAIDELTDFGRKTSGRDDEINDLENSFYQMTVDLSNYIKKLEVMTTAKQKIETELNVAKNIQDMLLPKIFPPFKDEDNFAIYAMVEPAKLVGGDYYDFYMVDEDHICITIADVSGKGVPAALFMVIAKTIMKNQAMTCYFPATVLYNVNNQLSEENEEGMFVTAFFGVLEISTGKLTYANAGHNPPLLYRRDGSFELLPMAKSLVLAVMDGVEFAQGEMLLNSGDILFTYTDGVSEAANEEGELYSPQRLRETLNAIEDKKMSLSELVGRVRQSVAKHVQTAEQSDDITMLVLRKG